jgi:AcrR family transcriptional regulator
MAKVESSGGYTRKKEHTRARIIEAAKRNYVDRGVDETTVGLIATTAGVSTATVYNHFENSEAIESAVIDDIVRRYEHRQIELVDQDGDPAVRVCHSVRRLFALVDGDPLWVACMVHLSDRLPPIHEMPGAACIIGDGIEQGRFRVTPSRSLHDLLRGGIDRALKSRLAGETDSGEAETFARLVLQLLGLTPMQAAAAWRASLRRLPERRWPVPDLVGTGGA